MPLIRIWVYDGIAALSVAGSVDTFTAANAVWAERAEKNGIRRTSSPLLQWRIESPDRKQVETGEHERQVGVERLARSRRVKALELLEGALDAARKGTE